MPASFRTQSTNTMSTPGSVLALCQLLKAGPEPAKGISAHRHKAEPCLQNAQEHSVAACRAVKEICSLQNARQLLGGQDSLLLEHRPILAEIIHLMQKGFCIKCYNCT